MAAEVTLGKILETFLTAYKTKHTLKNNPLMKTVISVIYFRYYFKGIFGGRGAAGDRVEGSRLEGRTIIKKFY